MERLYLDQNYLSGIAKRKIAFRELEPVLRAAVARGAVAVPESEAHRLESAARPDLPLLALLREFSGGLALPKEPGAVERHCQGASRWSSNATSPSAGDRRAIGSTSVPSQLLCPLPARYLRRFHGRRRAPQRSPLALPL
jgi:hypothetical protein